MRFPRPRLLLASLALMLAFATPPAAAVGIVNAFPNLSFPGALFVTAAPGDAQRLFVVTQAGLVWVFNRSQDVSSTQLFLDLRSRVNQSGGELGLLGLAFDPDYTNNGFFYVNYNPAAGGLSTRISRFRVSPGNPELALPDSETVLLGYEQPFANHNGGWLGFGPDGLLYITAGDGGGAGDPRGNAQSLATPLGKMLRIRRDGTIPADNPFVGVVGARGEIWAYGLRNPFRASFDPVTGKLWAGDVGQGEREEVDIISRGGNYGWNVYEGSRVYRNPGNRPPTDFTPPLFEYDHNDGSCSVIGGYVYRGTAAPALDGRYLFGDFCTGLVYALSATPNGSGQYTREVLTSVPGGVSSFGTDNDGELYLTSLDGAIYRLTNEPGQGQVFPERLSDTGLFVNTVTLTPAAELVEYQVNAPFWSDGTAKRRWFRLPPGAQIGFDALKAWDFPVGSRTVKHFEIGLANGQTRRLETRVFERRADGWHGVSYRWNANATDAFRVDSSQTETLQTLDLAGTPISQDYEYPSPVACQQCHASAGHALGLKTPQLNRSGSDKPFAVNQLRTFDRAGHLDDAYRPLARYSAYADPAGTRGSLPARARAYLDSNCAQCHRPNGPTGVAMDLRAETPIAATNTVNVVPLSGDLGIANARRIAARSKETSVLWQRMRRLDGDRMPNIGSHRVDEAGVALIGQWIDAGAQ